MAADSGGRVALSAESLKGHFDAAEEPEEEVAAEVAEWVTEFIAASQLPLPVADGEDARDWNADWQALSGRRPPPSDGGAEAALHFAGLQEGYAQSFAEMCAPFTTRVPEPGMSLTDGWLHIRRCRTTAAARRIVQRCSVVASFARLGAVSVCAPFAAVMRHNGRSFVAAVRLPLLPRAAPAGAEPPEEVALCTRLLTGALRLPANTDVGTSLVGLDGRFYCVPAADTTPVGVRPELLSTATTGAGGEELLESAVKRCVESLMVSRPTASSLSEECHRFGVPLRKLGAVLTALSERPDESNLTEAVSTEVLARTLKRVVLGRLKDVASSADVPAVVDGTCAVLSTDEGADAVVALAGGKFPGAAVPAATAQNLLPQVRWRVHTMVGTDDDAAAGAVLLSYTRCVLPSVLTAAGDGDAEAVSALRSRAESEQSGAARVLALLQLCEASGRAQPETDRAVAAARESGSPFLLSVALQLATQGTPDADDAAAALLQESYSALTASSSAGAPGPAACGAARLLGKIDRGTGSHASEVAQGLERLEALIADGVLNRGQCATAMVPLLRIRCAAEAAAGQPEAAEKTAATAAELADSIGSYSDEGALALLQHGRCLVALGRLDEAISPLERAHGDFCRLQGHDARQTSAAAYTLARVYLEKGRRQDSSDRRPPDRADAAASARYQAARLLLNQVLATPATDSLCSGPGFTDCWTVPHPHAAVLDVSAQVSQALCDLTSAERQYQQCIEAGEGGEAVERLSEVRALLAAAASTVQSAGRGYGGRRAVADLRLKQQSRELNDASVKIQALQRGRAARRRSLDRKTQRATEQEQRIYSAAAAEQNAAATRIQARHRGRAGRKKAAGVRRDRKREHAKRDEAATRIQGVARGRQARRRSRQLLDERDVKRVSHAASQPLPPGSPDSPVSDPVLAVEEPTPQRPPQLTAAPSEASRATPTDPWRVPLPPSVVSTPTALPSPGVAVSPSLDRWQGAAPAPQPSTALVRASTPQLSLRSGTAVPASALSPLPLLSVPRSSSVAGVRGARAYAAHMGRKQAQADMQWWANKTRMLRTQIERARVQGERADALEERQQQARRQHRQLQAEITAARIRQASMLSAAKAAAGEARQQRRAQLRDSRLRLVAWKAEGRERAAAQSSLHADAIRAFRASDRNRRTQLRDSVQDQHEKAAKERQDRSTRLRAEAALRFEERVCQAGSEQRQHEDATLRLVQGSAELLHELRSLRRSQEDRAQPSLESIAASVTPAA